MGSSGGDSGGWQQILAMQAANPMPGLPIAGADSTIGDPYEYGKFQNFLPDAKTEGPNDMASGLRPDMFSYRKPNPGGGANSGNQLRDTLAATVAGSGTSDATAAATSGSGSQVGTMGLGGGGPFANGLAPPPGAQQLPTPPGGWVTPYPVQVNANSGFPTDWRAKEAAAKAAAGG